LAFLGSKARFGELLAKMIAAPKTGGGIHIFRTMAIIPKLVPKCKIDFWIVLGGK
jgi:hypothetical protein